MLSEGSIAVKSYRIYRKLYLWHIPLLPGMIARVTRHFTRILLPPEVQAGKNLSFAHIGNVVIHEDTIIGDNVQIYHNVTIGTARPDLPNDKAPKIGNNVIIFTGAVVLSDVPDNKIIKANEVYYEKEK